MRILLKDINKRVIFYHFKIIRLFYNIKSIIIKKAFKDFNFKIKEYTFKLYRDKEKRNLYIIIII